MYYLDFNVVYVLLTHSNISGKFKTYYIVKSFTKCDII